MRILEAKPAPEPFGNQQPRRGYHVPYRLEETNHCPGCGRTHWYVGRVSAECAFCGTALELPEGTKRGGGCIIRSKPAEAI